MSSTGKYSKPSNQADNEYTFTNEVWSWKHWERFVEERFEKDVFFCYTAVQDNIPFAWKAVYTTLAKILWFMVAIYFTVTFYLTDQGNTYISLQKSPGCTEVPIPINNVFTLDLDGNWNGQQGHVESTSFVRVRLSELTSTLAEFDSFMVGVTGIVLQEAALSRSRDLAGNLASLMAWQRDFFIRNALGVTTKHVIEFTADVAYVFDRFYKVGVLSNVESDCDVYMPVSYDRDTATVVTTVDETAFLASSNCAHTMDPQLFGYSGYASGPDISITVDLHSLTIAYGISSGLVTLESFTLIVDPVFGDFDVLYGDDIYNLKIGIDEKFPGMDPVYCLIPEVRANATTSYNFDTLCVIKVAGQYVYPFFNHGGLAFHPNHGFDANTPLMCDCADGTGLNEPCSDFDFFIGFLHFNTSSVSAVFHEILTMAYEHTPEEINKLSYNASFAAQRLGSRASTHPPPGADTGDAAALARLSDPVWRREAYAFCNNCSMFSLHIFDDLNYRSNDKGLQIFNGSCNDVITPNAKWTTIAPPSQTIEDYFKCKPNQFDSFVNGLGIGVGDATIVVPTLIILTIPILHLLAFYFLSVEQKETERKRFADLHEGFVFATHSNGGHYAGSSGSKNKFVETSLVEDLHSHALHEHGAEPHPNEQYHHGPLHNLYPDAGADGHGHQYNHELRHNHGRELGEDEPVYRGHGAHEHRRRRDHVPAVRPVPLQSPESLISPGVVMESRHLFPVHLSEEERRAIKESEEQKAHEIVAAIAKKQKEARLARNKTLVTMASKSSDSSPFKDTGPITRQDHRESSLHPNSDSESSYASSSSSSSSSYSEYSNSDSDTFNSKRRRSAKSSASGKKQPDSGHGAL